jgi:hypothetical protein
MVRNSANLQAAYERLQAALNDTSITVTRRLRWLPPSG